MSALRKKLYLAAPLFSVCERDFNKRLKTELTDYCDVFLPQEDGNLFVNLVASGMAIPDAVKKVFSSDIEAILDADAVLVVLDGRTVDEGAAFEVGFAFAKGIPCIGLQTDMRRLLPIGNNPMIDASLLQVFENIETLLVWAKTFSPGQRCYRA